MPAIPPTLIYHHATVTTTMTVARELFQENKGKVFGVAAEEQTQGKGTGGRTWNSPKGNMYFTLCVPELLIPKAVVPVLSLAIGLACRKAVMSFFPSVSVGLKWPNDIVYQSKKIGGTIIESDEDYFLFGIGMNVDVAPPVVDDGRESTCINQIARDLACPPVAVADLAARIWNEFFSLALSESTTRASIIAEFEANMDYTLKLRERLEDGRGNEVLTAVRLTEWGHLVVKSEAGSEKTLSAAYLF